MPPSSSLWPPSSASSLVLGDHWFPYHQWLHSTCYKSLHLPLCRKGSLFVLWVNNIIPIASSPSKINLIKALLQSKYELNDLGELHEYLGIFVSRNLYLSQSLRAYSLPQESYAKKIPAKFHLFYSLPSLSPSIDSLALLANNISTSVANKILYQAHLGSLMYLNVWTQPDISERFSKLGKYASNPNDQHASSL